MVNGITYCYSSYIRLEGIGTTIVAQSFNILPITVMCFEWFAGGSDREETSEMSHPDTIYIQGLPDNVDEEILIKHFGSIGPIKVLPKEIVCFIVLWSCSYENSYETENMSVPWYDSLFSALC